MAQNIDPIESEPKIFDETFKNLEQSMKAAAAKQSVIAHNIANANVPGYEPMDFDEELGMAVKRIGEKKVILEKEIAKMSDNSLRYSAYVKLLTQKLGILRTIVTQGRK